MWVRQFSVNDYNQHGYYTTKVWANKPTLVQIAGGPLEGLDEQQLVKIVSMFKGEEVDMERIVEVNKDGTIPYEF